MKIINLGRGQGKTIRLLYANEFNDTPILCSNLKQKDYLLNTAEKLHLNIPEPLCVCDIFSDKIRGNRSFDNGVLVDDAEWVLQQMLYNVGLHSEIKGMSITDITDANRYTSSNRRVSWNVEKLEKYDEALKNYVASCDKVDKSLNELADALSTTRYGDFETKL